MLYEEGMLSVRGGGGKEVVAVVISFGVILLVKVSTEVCVHGKAGSSHLGELT